MKQIILGTAGHIDHGKTSLIKTLTGIDTDRLKEEKLRGITIELGFASLDLPGGQHLGIVDVPGHEKFVKNMVAGATGIDIVTMIIAADEGVMPQTREHMEICTLLDIKHGFVVLTKIDMVDEEWLELVTEDVSEFVQGTFLENSPILPVSSTTGQGLQELTQSLDKLCENIPGHTSSGLFRLPVDRVFTMKGFGTVITGSLYSGKISTGDTIMVYPSGITSKVRGIQVHNQSVDEAESGMRTAINFQGLEKASANRGDVLSTPNALKSSYMLDVTLNFLKSNEKPLKNRTRVRFHSGTSEIMGNLILLDREELKPGESIEAQIRLDSPVACVRDDRYVLRSYSPVRTIGGGKLLNPIPKKHKRFKPEIIDGLKRLVAGTPEEIISLHVEQAGYSGVSFSDLKIMTNLPEKHLQNTMSALLSKRAVIQADRENRVYIHENTIENLDRKTLALLGKYHSANPLKEGMPREELKTKLPSVLHPKLFNLILSQMIKENKIVGEENTVRLAGYKVSMEVDQEDISRKILKTYLQAGLTPPYFKELGKTLDINTGNAKDVLMHLVDQGKITRVKDDLYYHSDVVNDLKNRLVDFFTTHEEITTPQFKEMTGASRKYVIPLIEYFDAIKLTIRIGDIRKLRKGR